MELDGFVSVSSTQNIQTTSTDNTTTQFANQFRYSCMQLHPEASEGICNAKRVILTVSPAGNVDWPLLCCKHSCSPDIPTYLMLCCRVCARYTGHAQVTLNGVTLTTSPAGNFDSTLVCHDYSYLPSGLLPISVQYASDPTDVNNAFEFWIIPVKSVTVVANPVGSPSIAHAEPLRR